MQRSHFTLPQTLEQCHEWNTLVYTNFMDFVKALDIVHRESLWAMPIYYGIPTKIVSIIQLLYSDLKSIVICGSCLPEEFEVNTGIKQGCILSLLQFSLSMDWLMRETMQGGQRNSEVLSGIFERHLDFANDAVLLSHRFSDIQTKGGDLARNPGKTTVDGETPK